MEHPDQGKFDERAPGLFAPDTLLASQYFDRVRRRAAVDGERRLIVAVLEDAVYMYLKHVAAESEAHQALFREAEEWIEDPDTQRFLSFENVCAVLDLDAEYLRRGLRAVKERARAPQTASRVAADKAIDKDDAEKPARLADAG